MCCKVTEEIKKLPQERFSGIISTQAVEDCNGHMKNAGQIKGTHQKHRTPVSFMATCMKHCVLHQRHQYGVVDIALSAANRSIALDHKCFQMPLKVESMDFGEIVSAEQTTDWFSPQSQALCAPCFDIPLLGACSGHYFNKLKDSWLGGQLKRSIILDCVVVCVCVCVGCV